MINPPPSPTTRRRAASAFQARMSREESLGRNGRSPAPTGSPGIPPRLGFEGWTIRLLRLSILCVPLGCALGVFLMAAGTDETWILLGPRGWLEGGRYGSGSPFRCDFSTAGLHAAYAALLDWAGGGRLEVIRMATPICLAILAYVLYRFAERVLGVGGAPCWIAVAPVLAVRGTFMLGAQAYGEILATLLVVTGALLWDTLPRGSWARRLGVAAVLGAAAAVRLNCVLGLLALVVPAAFLRGRRRAELADAGMAILVGGLFFAAQWGILQALSVPVGPEAAQAALEAYGLGNPLLAPLAYAVPERLGVWRVGEDLLPFLLVGLVLAGWIWVRRQVDHASGMDVLLGFGMLLWLAWHLLTPIAHLRYLWPALVCFHFGGGILLATIYLRARESRQAVLRLGVLAVCGACVLSGYLDGLRTYLHGDGDLQSWEWHRGTRQCLQYGPFKLASAQRQMVERLRQIPETSGIATLGFDTALGYLVRRPIVPLDYFWAGKDRGLYRREDRPSGLGFPEWIVVTPMINRFPFTHLTAALHRWMETNCELEDKFGPYVLYRLVGSSPLPPEPLPLSSWESPLPLVSPSTQKTRGRGP